VSRHGHPKGNPGTQKWIESHSLGASEREPGFSPWCSLGNEPMVGVTGQLTSGFSY
jgi:hypothetical protein